MKGARGCERSRLSGLGGKKKNISQAAAEEEPMMKLEVTTRCIDEGILESAHSVSVSLLPREKQEGEEEEEEEAPSTPTSN